jgi:hypothetical protein
LGPALGLILFLILVSPIVIWNQQHHWPTLGHLLGHLGVPGGDKPIIQGKGGWKYDPVWTLSFMGAQLAAGPMLILAFLQARRAYRGRAERPGQWRGAAYLLCVAAPLLVFYLIVSFVANTQWNWTIAAFTTLAVLAGIGAAFAPDGEAPVRTGLFAHSWRATVIVGLVLGLGALRLDMLAKLPGAASIPIWRFTGGEQMGAHVERLIGEVEKQTGAKPFVLAQHYGRAAQLAFYIPSHPTVYCSSSLMLDGRLTPYDFWAQTDLRRHPELIGRPAVLIGNADEDWAPLFDRVEEVGTLDGDGKKNRPAFKAYNFRGFPPGGLRMPDAPVFENP